MTAGFVISVMYGTALPSVCSHLYLIGHKKSLHCISMHADAAGSHQ